MSYPMHTPKKKSRVWLIVVVVALAVVAVCICGAAVIANSGTEKKPDVPAATTPTGQPGSVAQSAAAVQPPPVTTAAAPKVPTITDGTWTVGEDFPAGNYKAIGAGSTCYWSITKSGTNGSDIIDNHIGGGNLRVTLKAGQDFETKRCGTWTKA